VEQSGKMKMMKKTCWGTFVVGEALTAEIDLDLFDGVPRGGNEDGVLLDQLGRGVEFQGVEQVLHVAPQHVAVLIPLGRCVEEPRLVCATPTTTTTSPPPPPPPHHRDEQPDC
jgi:hypothetical protein